MRDDRELLDAWRSGDRMAGDELFSRHFASVCRFFRNKVDDAVEDLVQRTFLASVESSEQIRDGSSFRAYVLGVARHILYRSFREKQRHDRRFDPLNTSVSDLSPSPSAIVARRQEQVRLLEALRRIPIESQVLLELHYWEDMPALEVAEVIGVPVGTAKSRIRKAKQLLLRSLTRQLPGVEPPDEATLDDWARQLRELVDDRLQSS